MIARVELGTGSMCRSLASRTLESSSSSIAVRQALSIARARSATLAPRQEGASRKLGHFGPVFTAPVYARRSRCNNGLVLGFEIEMMDRFDEADGPRLRAHHDAVGRRTAGEEAHAAQIIAGGHARRREHYVVAGQLLQRIAMLEIHDAHRKTRLGFLAVARYEAALHLAAGRTNGGAGEHALMRSADSDQHVDFAFRTGGRDRGRQVTGRDHLDSGAGAADF